MARISLSICDFCKATSQSNLNYELELSDCFDDKDKVVEAEICESCYLKLRDIIWKETKPYFPGAVQNTPSEQRKSPDSITTGDPSTELLDNEINYIKSNFTEEKKRQVIEEMAKKCTHPNGFSMDEVDGKGIVCKDCGEKVNF